MKKILSIISFTALAVSAQITSAMGFISPDRAEGMASDYGAIEGSSQGQPDMVMVINSEGEELIAQVGAVGDVAAAVGVPYAHHADTVLKWALGGLAAFQTMRSRKFKKAGVTMARGIETGTDDGTIKRTILAQSVQDGTTKDIEHLVKSTVPKMVKVPKQMALDV